LIGFKPIIMLFAKFRTYSSELARLAARVRAHGAPFRTRVAAADFRFLAGEELVSFYESTPGTHRGFCKVCGAPVLVKFDERSRSAQTGAPFRRPCEHLPRQECASDRL
jgi:hypothetical protein